MSESNDIKDFPHFKSLEKQQFYPIYMKFIDDAKKVLDINKLNADIAVYFLLQTAFKYIQSHQDLTVGITQEALLNILYAFQYHDLSKEAIMALARNLVVYREG
jgi:hypothetical protein